MMHSVRVADGTFCFIFDELTPYLTTVTVLIRKVHVFVFDTFLGERFMQQIFAELNDAVCGKAVIAVNSHYHFDHVWGNSFFRRDTVLSSVLCREMMLQNGEAEMAAHADCANVDRTLFMPNEVFSGRRDFSEDGITVFSAPGHTEDGISLMDCKNGILLVGDNVERPLIEIESLDLAAYMKTLGTYLSLPVSTIIGGHNERLTKADVRFTLDYVRRLNERERICFSDPVMERCHRKNAAVLDLK